MENLNTYFINCLEDIKDITEEQKKEVEEQLTKIMNDSSRHAHMFSQLIQMVVENGEDTY